jgi:AAHS family 4-hydroxybenzoate transporter-like MFS transporter
MSEYVPERRRSLLVVTMFCGFTLGASGGGFGAAGLIPEHGWRSVFLVGGIAPLLMAAILLVALPESARYLVVRGKDPRRIAAILNRIAPGSASPGQAFTVPEQAMGEARNPVAGILGAKLRIGTLCLWTAYFMGLVGILLPQSWMPTLMHTEGYGMAQAASITALFQLGGTAGAFLVGYGMDRFGGHRPIAVAFLLGGVFMLAMAQVSSSPNTLALTVAVAGFFSSGAQTSLSALAANFYPTQVRATGVAWMLGVGRWGAVLGAFIGGPLLAAGLGFKAIFSFLLLPMALAAIAVAVKGAAYRRAGATHLAEGAGRPAPRP